MPRMPQRKRRSSVPVVWFINRKNFLSRKNVEENGRVRETDFRGIRLLSRVSKDISIKYLPVIAIIGAFESCVDDMKRIRLQNFTPRRLNLHESIFDTSSTPDVQIGGLLAELQPIRASPNARGPPDWIPVNYRDNWFTPFFIVVLHVLQNDPTHERIANRINGHIHYIRSAFRRPFQIFVTVLTNRYIGPGQRYVEMSEVLNQRVSQYEDVCMVFVSRPQNQPAFIRALTEEFTDANNSSRLTFFDKPLGLVPDTTFNQT